MQRFYFTVLAALLAAGAVQASDLAAPDVAAVQEKLQGMLAGSQQRLQMVEQKNAEVVKKIKDKAGSILSAQAEFLGKTIQDYSSKLWASEKALKDAETQAQQALDAYNKNPPKPGTTPQATLDAKASLMAKISVTQRQLRRAQTRREGALNRVENDASERLDDEAMRLGTKLGDLTKWVDPSKQELSEMSDEANEDPVKLAEEKAKAAAMSAEDDPDAGLLDVMQKDGFQVTPAPKAKAKVEAKKVEAKKVETKKVQKPVEKKASSDPGFKQLAKNLDKALKAQTETAKTAQAAFKAEDAKDEKDSQKKFDDLAKELLIERKKLTAMTSA